MDFDEGNLHFSFDDTWQVIKYDDTELYREGVGRLQGTKAIDFLGLRENDLFLIEAKDFRGYRIENQKRVFSGDLAIEIGQKVRDTVAGLLGAYRNSDPSVNINEYFHALCNSEIKVVIWLEQDIPSYLPKREKVKKSVEGNVFKQKTNWLTSKVFVLNMNENILSQSGLSVSNLPHHSSN